MIVEQTTCTLDYSAMLLDALAEFDADPSGARIARELSERLVKAWVDGGEWFTQNCGRRGRACKGCPLESKAWWDARTLTEEVRHAAAAICVGLTVADVRVIDDPGERKALGAAGVCDIELPGSEATWRAACVALVAPHLDEKALLPWPPRHVDGDEGALRDLADRLGMTESDYRDVLDRARMLVASPAFQVMEAAIEMKLAEHRHLYGLELMSLKHTVQSDPEGEDRRREYAMNDELRARAERVERAHELRERTNAVERELEHVLAPA